MRLRAAGVSSRLSASQHVGIVLRFAARLNESAPRCHDDMTRVLLGEGDAPTRPGLRLAVVVAGFDVVAENQRRRSTWPTCTDHATPLPRLERVT